MKWFPLAMTLGYLSSKLGFAADPIRCEYWKFLSPKLSEQVASVQEELAIGKQLIKRGVKNAQRGLLISGYTPEQIRYFLDGGGMVVTARDAQELKERLSGYLLATHPDSFLPKFHDANVSWSSERQRDHLEPILNSKDFLYLDQIGVRFRYIGTPTAHKMLKLFEQQNPGRNVITLIMTDPVNNIRSIRFFERNGYKVFSNIHFVKYGMISNFMGVLLHKKIEEK